MTLTIPRAGVIAGRAPQLTPQQPSQVGAGLSALGDKMADMGLKYKAEKLDYQGKKIQLDLARDLAAARLEAEQLGDPEVIGATWDARKAEITQRYLKGKDDAGNPIVPDALRPGIELTAAELDNRHTAAIATKKEGLFQSQRAANWIETYDRVALEASKADAETAGAMLEVADDAINQAIANGTMSPEDAAKARISLRETVATGRAVTIMETDPEAFLKRADEGEFDDLGGEGLARAKAKAQGDIYRKAAAAETAAKVAAKAEETAISNRLDEMAGMMFKGFTLTDENYLTDPKVIANPNYGKVMAAKALQTEIPAIKQMTIPQLDEQIASEEAAPKSRKYQLERIDLLRQWRDAAVTKWNTDGVEQARLAKMPVNDLPSFDAQAPNDFAAALPGRIALDRFATSNEYTATQALFSGSEKAQLEKVLDPKADVGPKLALAGAILSGAKGDTSRVMTVLGADPTFRRAAWALENTGDSALAEGILRGKQKAELKTVILPAPRMMQQAFDAATGGAFDGNPTFKAELLDAAAALYADQAAGIDPESQSSTGWLDDSTAIDLFTQSIQRVTGAQADANGKMTIGGVQEINDGFVSLPVGVAAKAVEGAFENLGQHLRGQRRSANGWDSSPTDTPPDIMRAFKAASVDGRVPALGADPQSTFADLTLQRLMTRDGRETDQYIFMRNDKGRSVPVSDANGVEYRFRLPALIREAGK